MNMMRGEPIGADTVKCLFCGENRQWYDDGTLCRGESPERPCETCWSSANTIRVDDVVIFIKWLESDLEDRRVIVLRRTEAGLFNNYRYTFRIFRISRGKPVVVTLSEILRYDDWGRFPPDCLWEKLRARDDVSLYGQAVDDIAEIARAGLAEAAKKLARAQRRAEEAEERILELEAQLEKEGASP